MFTIIPDLRSFYLTKSNHIFNFSELRDLKFPWIPDFRIIEMAADLPMSCLDVSFNLGPLRVEGMYEANNSTLRKWLPVSHVGKLL